MTKRIFNFSAGPATLPWELLTRAQEECWNYNNEGMSIMEMSHRSKTFEEVHAHAKQGLIDLLNIPDNYDVLFLQGGASLQFSMVPMNLKQDEKPIDVINTGVWTKKAIKEIKKESECRIIASSEDDNFLSLPSITSDIIDPNSALTYMCSNNTIYGTQFKSFPDTGASPLVADMSSDILSRALDINQFGLIFAGAQKNIGPSGVTIVIIRKDLAERASEQLPSMLQYRSFIKTDSMYNTIPTFGVYMVGLMTDWLKDQGGINAIEERNQKKAKLLYDAIDESDYYHCPVERSARSDMNVVFKIKAGESYEKQFVEEANKQGLSGLKGHRSIGGLRASIYNAHPEEGIRALIDFMKVFEKNVLTKQAVSA